MKRILAEVEVPSALPLDMMAQKLSNLIGGSSFELDETGRFEEVPAFIAKDDTTEMTFVLFGIPENETCDSYILECSGKTILSIAEFGEKLPKFMHDVLGEKDINARGYYDYSDELAKKLIANGINAVKAAP